MAEQFTARFLDAWPDTVIEGVRRESPGAVVESDRSLNRRLIPIHDMSSIVSALCALVTLSRTIWTQRKGATKAEVPEASTDTDKLNKQIRLSGNFGAEVTGVEVKSAEPLRLEVSIRNPPLTDPRQFVLEFTGDSTEIKQRTSGSHN